MPSKVWDEMFFPQEMFSDVAIEVKEWINNLTTHFMMDVITYSCWDWC